MDKGWFAIERGRWANVASKLLNTKASHIGLNFRIGIGIGVGIGPGLGIGPCLALALPLALPGPAMLKNSRLARIRPPYAEKVAFSEGLSRMLPHPFDMPLRRHSFYQALCRCAAANAKESELESLERER